MKFEEDQECQKVKKKNTPGDSERETRTRPSPYVTAYMSRAHRSVSVLSLVAVLCLRTVWSANVSW